MAKSSPPSAPDPYQTAQAQYEYGTQAANYSTQLARPDVNTPYGSTTWSTSYGGEPAGFETSYAPLEVPGYGVLAGGSATPASAVYGGGNEYGAQEAPWAAESGALIAGAPSYGAPYYGTGTGIGATTAPTYTETETLSPAQQQLLNLQEGNQISGGLTSAALAGQMAGNLSQPIQGFQTSVAPTSVQQSLNTAGIPGIAGAGDLAGFTQQAQKAAYQQQTQYLDPQFQQEQQQLDAQLRNSGAQPGSAAYDNAMRDFNLAKQQAYSNAENQAVAQGLAEQQALYGESANTNEQLFGQTAAAGQFANSAAAQQLQQELEGADFANAAALQYRDLPLSEYEMLTQGTAAPVPSFGFGGTGGSSGAATVQAPDIMSAFQNYYQGQLAGYNANTASTNADIGAGASLAAAAIIAA